MANHHIRWILMRGHAALQANCVVKLEPYLSIKTVFPGIGIYI